MPFDQEEVDDKRMHTLRRTTTLTVALALLLALLFGVLAMFGSKPAGAETGPEVEPKLLDGRGNFSCASQGYDYELKIDSTELAEGQTYTAATTAAGDSGPLSVTLSNLVFDGNEVKQFDWASNNFAVDAVLVKAQETNAFIYDPPQESMGDDGLYAPENKGISHISFCYDLELQVTKNATTSFTRTNTWDIKKSATPKEWNLFEGDSGTSDYKVSVEKSVNDSDFAVEGTITIKNPAPDPAVITGVTDEVLQDDGTKTNATVQCQGVQQFPFTLAADSTLTCTYEVSLNSGEDGTNTATATTDSASKIGSGSGTADVDFGDPTNVVGPSEITVSDSIEGDLGTFADDGEARYSKKFSCPADEGTHNNTATINETGQSASASVEVKCFALGVSKDAEASFKRSYDWSIVKNGDQTELTLAAGQQFLVNYTTTVDATPTDSDHAVSGTITIHNPAPMGAEITSVSDVVSPDIAANVECADANGPVSFPYTLAAGGTLECSYSTTLPDSEDDRLNTATATLQNYDYDSELNATAGGTTDFSGTANVVFGDPQLEDEKIDVTDDSGTPSVPSDDRFLGTVDATVDTLPKTFNYSMFVGPYSESGDYSFTNTATFVTDDTGTEGSDDHTVVIHVPGNGCTLTIGYWKTHAGFTGNNDDMVTQYLPIWLGTPNGQYSVQITTAAQVVNYLNKFEDSSNGIRKLQAQLLAAKLNIANGASTQGIASIISSADAFLAAHPASDWTTAGALTKAQKNQVLSWATKLDNYNNGIIGPGHCSE
jgi:LEA14-like dessication related protein